MTNIRVPAQLVSRLPYLVMLVAALGAWYLVASSHKSQRRNEHFRIGLETRIGFAPIYVAHDMGFLDQDWIDFELLVLDGVGARTAAFQANELDFFPSTPSEFTVLFSSQQPRGKLVAALDESVGAYGIVAQRYINSIRDLKGKRVGFQKGTDSQFLLLELLKRDGLSGADLIPDELSTDDAGRAFLSDSPSSPTHLDAAATWEPWLSKAQTPTKKVLARSDATRGLIVDVLLASDRALKDDGRPLTAFMDSWYRGVGFISSDASRSEAIVARALSLTPEAVHEQLAKIHFYSRGESIQYMRSELPCVLRDANDLYKENRVIVRKADVSRIVDFRVLGGE
jgi:NitT/TauT family transport system substrate-binding protein